MKSRLIQLLLSVTAILFAAALGAQTGDGDAPRGLIMIDKRAALVRFFEPETLQEISNLSIDGVPHELAISPDQNTAYVPHYGDGVYGNNPNPGRKIAVIDLTSRKVRDVIDISPYEAPHGMQVDQNGTLYVSCDLSRKLLIIDPQTLTVTKAIDTDGTGHWLAVLPDGSKAYVANKNDRPFVSVIDLKAGKMVGRISMPNGTQGIALAPGGEFVLAIDLTDPVIRKIDTSTDTVVDDILIEGTARGLWGAKFSPDRRTIAVINARERSVSFLKAADPRSQQRTVTVGSQPFGIEFSADSKTALISNHGDGTLSVVDVAGGRVVRTVDVGVGVETLAYY